MEESQHTGFTWAIDVSEMDDLLSASFLPFFCFGYFHLAGFSEGRANRLLSPLHTQSLRTTVVTLGVTSFISSFRFQLLYFRVLLFHVTPLDCLQNFLSGVSLTNPSP